MVDRFYVYHGAFDKETARAEISAISPTPMESLVGCDFIRATESDIKDVIDGLRPVSFFVIDGTTDRPRVVPRSSISETTRTLEPYLVFAGPHAEPELRVVLDRVGRQYRVEMSSKARSMLLANKGCWNGVRFVGLTLFVMDDRNPAYIIDSFKAGPELLDIGEVIAPMLVDLPVSCTVAAPRMFERITCEDRKC